MSSPVSLSFMVITSEYGFISGSAAGTEVVVEEVVSKDDVVVIEAVEVTVFFGFDVVEVEVIDVVEVVVLDVVEVVVLEVVEVVVVLVTVFTVPSPARGIKQ